MNTYLWVKSFHLIAMVAWFAGLFYLPRLFVYHAEAIDTVGIERFKIMERRLYFGITTPAAITTVALGFFLLFLQGLDWFFAAQWMRPKLILVAVLVVYHTYLGHLVNLFGTDRNSRSPQFYRWLNEFPLLILIPVVLLATIKPV